VLSGDPIGRGSQPNGDVLVEGDRIVEVGPSLDGGADAEVIDASGMIVMPGFVDTHRHIWEGILRNIGTDVPLEGRTSYISFVLHKLAPALRPEDAYAGNLVSALGAIDAGHHHAARLVAHPGVTGPHRRRDPGARRLGHASRLRLRLPVVGQVGGAPAVVVRPRRDASTSPPPTRS
jgi:cytosine/adenosine deaminase-related metal-dependent hydrolase